MGARFGDAKNPLLVSCRSGARVSMPGMMDTVLNLGLNDDTVQGLVALTQNERFAYDSYRRFIQMFGRIVLDIPAEHFDHGFEDAKQRVGAKLDTELDAAALRQVVVDFKQVVERATGQPFPTDPLVQLRLAIGAVFESWMGKRAGIEILGWGIVVVYVGHQSQGPGSGVAPDRATGVTDAQDALAKTASEGFTPQTIVYLEVEPMDHVPQAKIEYVNGWLSQFSTAQFLPGIYCHVKNANQLKGAIKDFPSEQVAFWVSGGGHFVAGTSRPAPCPAAPGRSSA
jgi:phosphoenolpyruvate synthase/pyruvate phosphate dikinase